jgi:hypothetical protein
MGGRRALGRARGGGGAGGCECGESWRWAREWNGNGLWAPFRHRGRHTRWRRQAAGWHDDTKPRPPAPRSAQPGRAGRPHTGRPTASLPLPRDLRPRDRRLPYAREGAGCEQTLREQARRTGSSRRARRRAGPLGRRAHGPGPRRCPRGHAPRHRRHAALLGQERRRGWRPRQQCRHAGHDGAPPPAASRAPAAAAAAR